MSDINIQFILGVARFAAKAHANQLDKAGDPYVLHPMRVAERVAAWGGSVSEIAAALLHDAIEDQGVKPEDLARDFGPPVAKLVVALSVQEGEPYDAYIERVIAGGARLIKMADVADNADESRLSKLPEPTASRLRLKYAKAQQMLASGG